MTGRAWIVHQENLVLDAAPYVEVYRQKVETERGEIVDDYYRVKLRDFVIGCALTTKSEVIALWQYKHGAGCYGLTFPAGCIEPHETAEVAMRRELLEESGYIAGPAFPLGRCACSGTQQTGFAQMFVLTDATRVATPRSGDLETAELRLMCPGDIDEAIRAGRYAGMPHLAVRGAARLHPQFWR